MGVDTILALLNTSALTALGGSFFYVVWELKSGNLIPRTVVEKFLEEQRRNIEQLSTKVSSVVVEEILSKITPIIKSTIDETIVHDQQKAKQLDRIEQILLTILEKDLGKKTEATQQ